MFFLREIASKIISENSNKIDDISVIIPNKRAAVYLQKFFAENLSKPLFAPEIITISEWVQAQSSQRILSQQELLFVMYEAHKVVNPTNTEDFSSFMKWGKTLVTDFDEIDRYLIKPEFIFRDLRNIKEIENWSFQSEELSPGQKRFMELWEKLPQYYNSYNELLEKENSTYSGKAYKQLANLSDLSVLPSRFYYFVGFNALSASEEKIIFDLIKQKKASFHSEIDQFYYLNNDHEAGHFFRELFQRRGIKPELNAHLNETPKKIEIIESAQQTGQIRIAGEILKRLLQSGASMTDTAIVLADESLLIPLLQELPIEIERANVTMGYPLRYTHLKSLIDQIFELQFNFQKFSTDALYFRSLLKVLDHSYLFSLVKEGKALNDFEKEIVKHNKVFIAWPELSDKVQELKSLNQVFTKWENIPQDGFNAIHALIRTLHASFVQLEKSLEQEILYQFATALRRFEKIWASYQISLDLKGFRKMFYQFWLNESISFLGNPTEGLQVMGILETRLLDFKNLIILGMNEGNLPQSNMNVSYLPYDLKKFHHLPTEEDRQAIFAHHFYRLLHRAEQIYITYNSGETDLGSAEQSRYITQLENELDTDLGHRIERFTYSPSEENSKTTEVIYQSNDDIRKRLDEYFQNQGLSPSALNKLVTCPLDFYYRYVLEMKEGAQVEEQIESSTFGTKIHEVLEDIFREHFLNQNKPVSADVLANERKKLHDRLLEKYLEKEEFSPTDLKYGQNKLSFEVSLGLLEKFIDQQIAELKKLKHPLFVEELEKKLSYEFEIQVQGTAKKIKLLGNADRIDKIGTTYRMIDYKSGKCDASKVEITEKIHQSGDYTKLLNDPRKGYARQLLMYALMYQNQTEAKTEFTAGIISMINLKDWIQNVRITKSESDEISPEMITFFRTALADKIAELYQSDFIFRHNPDSRYCEHCNK